MKKSLIVLFCICCGFAADAQSMLKVRLADNTPLNVAVDGRYFNKRGTSVTVGDLPQGRHMVKVYVMSQAADGRPYENIVYEGRVRTHEGIITILTYNAETNEVQLQDLEIDAYMSGQPAPASPGFQEQYGGNNNNPPQGNYDNNDGNQQNNQANEENSGPAASPAATGTLDDAKIDNLKTKVNAKKTDTERMNAMKDALAGETYTTFQVGTLMDLFSFESSKVDFAEWAYANTVDKDFFTDLETKLTYKNYRDDLDKFIKSKQ